MTGMITKILVPTDFSPSADAAVYTAADFARKFQAKLFLLYVVDIPGYGSFKLGEDVHGTSVEEIARNVALDRMQRLRQSDELKGVNLQIVIKSGKVYRTILDEAMSTKSDLVVMGTHGSSGIEKLLLGSNTKRLIRMSPVPVMVVKQPLQVNKIKNIAFASSFNQEYSFSFPMVYQFMELFPARLHLLKVITPQGFEASSYSAKVIEDFALDFNLKDYSVHVINAFTLEEGIAWFCRQEHIDLLFMTTHGRKGLLHLLTGSLTETMGHEYSIPIFSLKMMKVKTPRGVIFPD